MQFCLADERINGTWYSFMHARLPEYYIQDALLLCSIGPGNSTGNDYLVSQGFTNDIWTTQIALGSFIVGILFLAYLRLVLMKKNR